MITPDPLLQQYGADTVRMYSLFLGPADQDAEWFDGGVAGRYRVAGPPVAAGGGVGGGARAGDPGSAPVDGPGGALVRKAHWAIDKVSRDIGDRFAFNTAQSAVDELVNAVQGAPEATAEQRRFALVTAVSLVQPFAPHIACELWQRMGGERLWDAAWPVADPALLVSDTSPTRCR